MKTINQDYDVVVIGGGISGLVAAVAAARQGAKTLILERAGFLGGNATIGLAFLGFLDSKKRQITSGIAEEVVNRLKGNKGSMGITYDPHHNSVALCEPGPMKIVAFEMCKEAGVDILLHCVPYETEVENGRIKKFELYIGDDYDDYGEAVATGEWENSAAPKTVTLKKTKSGRYWKLVALSEVNGGAWASAAELSVVGCNGITTASEIPVLDNQISAYPVPTTGLVRLDVPANREYTYTIFSPLGVSTGSGKIQKESTGQDINLMGYDSGIYLIRLMDGGGVCYWVKVVKN